MGRPWGPYSTVYSTVAMGLKRRQYRSDQGQYSTVPMEGSPGTVEYGGHGVRPGQYSAVTMRETRGRTVQ